MAGGVWRELPKGRFRIRKAMLLLLVIGIGYFLFFSHHEKPVPVILSLAVSKDIPVYLDAAGKVQANQTVTVRTQTDGQLAEILFREGQDVKVGDILAKIDPRTYQAQYDEAVANKTQDEAMLAKAKNDLAKNQSSKNGSKNDKTKNKQARNKPENSKDSPKTLDARRSIVRQFEATVKSDQVVIDTLKTQLNRSIIASPIDGRTGIRQVDAGNMVHPSDSNGLVVITQMEPVSVLFNLPEKSLLSLSDLSGKNEKTKVLAMDADNHTLLDTGELEMVDNQVDPVSGTIRLKATFPNHKRLLWPGASVHVRLLASTRHNVVVVPAGAVHQGSSKPFVFVYNLKNNTVEKRLINVTMMQDENAIIEDGVQAGEKVVSVSQATLVDGSHVIPKDTGNKDK